MTADDFRDLALSMNGAVEGSHMGHPDFRANGRIFATLHPGDRKGMVKLAPEEQRQFMREHPQMFEPSSGAWGRQGCTDVLLAAADRATVRGAVVLAWEAVSAKKRTAQTGTQTKRPPTKRTPTKRIR
jgi:YjbR